LAQELQTEGRTGSAVPACRYRGLARRDDARAGRRARSLPDASSWVTIAQPRTDGAPSGVIVAESAVSSISEAGIAYRGYPIEELVENASFEEICLLLWRGERPSAVDTEALGSAIAGVKMPAAVAAALEAAGRDAPPLARLAITIAALAAVERPDPGEPQVNHAPAIIGLMPLAIVSTHNKNARSDAERGDIATRLFSRSLGAALQWEKLAVSRILIACAEHELNASTFAARVVASTGADLYASVLAALCSLSGPIHGGACDRIERMFGELEAGSNIHTLLADFDERNLLPPGFGHAIYPNGDPRAALLKKVAGEIARRRNRRLLETAFRVEEIVWKRQRLHPNLDFYLTVCVRMLGFPPGLPAGVFALGRTAGWIAHSLEQYADNRLIRPRMRYRGSPLRHWQ
jgi:citrate synthase